MIRRRAAVFLCAALSLAQIALTQIALAQVALTPEMTGRHALDLLLAADYTALSEMCAPAARALMTPAFLQEKVGSEIQKFGAVQDIAAPVLSQAAGNNIVVFPVRFASISVNVQFTVTPANQIGGLFFRPANMPAASWHSPSYSDPAKFTEQPLVVGSGYSDEWKLGATLTLPAGKGPFPGVVLVHGSGPNDRDESIYSNKVFKDLAEGLATRGIAVLRYDKRTNIYGPKFAGSSFTLNEETIEDAVRAAALLRSQPGIDPRKIYVLGHSLGGYAAPRIAKRDGKLAGIILMAANARPLEDVISEQNDYALRMKGGANPEDSARLAELHGYIAQIKSLQPGGKHDAALLLGLPASYWLDLKGYDPVAEAGRLNIPVLLLQGESDFQVTGSDSNLWKTRLAADTKVTYKSFPGLNHLFMRSAGSGTPLDYRQPANVDIAVINSIAAWLSAR